jgi:hypothetical protein
LIADRGTTSANSGQAPIAKVAVYALDLASFDASCSAGGCVKGRAMALDCPRARWTLKPRDMANNVVEGCWEEQRSDLAIL